MATIDKRRTRDGGVRWRARIRRRGMSETESFGSRAKAERWAKEVERAIERGDWVPITEPDDIRLDQLLDHFLASEERSSDTRRQLEWWRSKIGSESVAAISKRRILRHREILAREEVRPGRQRSPATVNRYLSALSALYTWALKKGWIDHHPLRGISPMSEGEGRVRYLSDDDRERLLDSCLECGGVNLHALATLAISTGARRGELLGLRWSDIDLRSGSVVLGTGKSSTRRTLPLAGPAIDTLRPLAKVRRIGGDEVFADRSGRVAFPRRAWEAAVRDAEIDDFRFHDLRHSAAAYLAQGGASLAEIAEFLGHRSLQAVQRYAHLTDRRSHLGVDRLHRRLFDRDR